MSDDPPDRPPAAPWLSYAGRATRPGLSPPPADPPARRRQGPKMPANVGTVRVHVPADEATLTPDDPGEIRAQRPDPVPALRAAVDLLRDQLAKAEGRYERESDRADR